MATSYTLEDFMALQEGYNVEFKKAAGAEGAGKIPSSFWETYSAFANTEGGEIYLGVKENSDKSIEILGVNDSAKLKQDLFNLANNKNTISCNLLHNHSVETILVNQKTVLKITIPRASRKMRPVFVGSNPITGSYFRKNEGDYHFDEATVKKMLGEQGNDSLDARILVEFDLEDFDQDIVNAYRNIFASRAPAHPFLAQEQKEFLRSIGAWNKNRETKQEGPTLAGLLMFGKLRSILDELPNFILDYQERSEAVVDRWVDRITTDGTWSGNLFDFYRKVYQKLTADLKVPFKLEEGIRIDETPVHVGLREALVNALIHADYNGRVSVLIIKKPDMFEFRNPGLMRIPIEQALEGGKDNSDCRNRNLQKMFQLIGAGEQAGSGIPKIYQSWEQQHWRRPRIIEQAEPAQTRFELHMASLLSEEAIKKLDIQFGSGFRGLPALERIILATTISEEFVDHKRIREIDSAHPADISKAFRSLVQKGFLNQNGAGRGTVYCVKNKQSSIDLRSSSIDLPQSSIGLASSSIDLPQSSIDFEKIEADLARSASSSKKLSPSDMQSIVYDLCKLRPQKIERLAQLLNRSAVYIRNDYLKPLLDQGRITMQYPDKPQHPEQAYLAN